MRNKTLHPAEGFGETEAFEPVDEAADRGFSACKIEGNERTEPILLLARDGVSRIADRPRLIEARDGAMLTEDLRDLRRILLVDTKASVERAEAAKRQEGVERSADEAESITPPGELLE